MALPTPGKNGIPKNAIVHGACGAWWSGEERSHCGGCHVTLTGLTAFERHRRGMRCNPPETVGLVAREKPFGLLWGMPAPENGYAWRRSDDTAGEAA